MNIFRHSWQGKNTGWTYFHDIIPAGDTNIDAEDVTIIPLPIGCISYSTTNIEFDEVRLGLPKSSVIEITVKTDLLPADEVYTEFKTLLFKPSFVKSYEATLIKQDQLEFGTIHRIYYYYTYDIGSEFGYGYNELFEGLQLLGLKGEYNLSVEGLTEFKCEIEDVKFSILKQMKMSELINGFMWFAHLAELIEYRDSVIQSSFLVGEPYAVHGYKFVTQSAIPYVDRTLNTSDMKYALIRMSDFYDFINNALEEYYKDSIRNYKPNLGLNTSELEYIKTRYFAQDFTVAGDYGSQKTVSYQYLIAGIYKYASVGDFLSGEINSGVIGGLFHINDPKGLSNLYNNVYDFFNDFYESNLNCLTNGNQGQPDYLHSFGIFETVNEVDIDLVVQLQDYNNFKFTVNENSYKSIAVDKLDVENDDIDSYEAKLDNSKNEKNRNIIVSFHNLPNTQEYNKKHNLEDESKPLQLSDFAEYHQNFRPALENYLQLFYLDLQEPIDYPNYEFTLVHHHCSFKIDNDTYSNDIIPYELIEVDDLYQNRPTELMIQLQQQSGIMKESAEVLLKLLSIKEVAYIEITLNYNVIDRLTYFRDTFNRKFNIDISTIEPIIDNLGTEWLVISAETNIIDETTTLKLINNTAKLL